MDGAALTDLRKRSRGEQMQLRETFAKTVADPLGRGKVVAVANDERVEWRGTIGELRTRLVVDGTNLSIDVKFDNRFGDLGLAWNWRWVDEPGPGEAWDDLDRVRIFIGKGVAIEAVGMNLQERLTTVELLPAASLARLAEAMPRHYLGEIRLDDDGLRARFAKDLTSLPGDRVESVRQALQTLTEVAATWAAIELTPQMEAKLEAEDADAPRATCTYCTTTFLLGVTSNCPNCGAPA